MLALERGLAQLAGQAGQNAAARAMAAARMSQTDFLRRQEAEERRRSAMEDLRRLRAERAERAGRIAVLRHRIAALTLRAPEAGVVYDLRVSGPGMVLRPAEPVLALHPTGRPLTIRARIPAAEAARLHPGQPAHLTIPAFRAEHLPDLEGHLRLLSPDILSDPQSGQPDYSAEIRLDPATLLPFGPDRLRAGLPVEVYLDTGSQSAIRWLLAPLRGYFRRAFREN
ncbi:HlyD family efflux transporter periplasmic adaptor subunit [Thioclava sp. BHET1]|nr:HlyD family efflux transporter periplasmic adaptor subunit [Thioclava sp. BHET1]